VLKQRWITTIFLTSFIVWAIFGLDSAYFATLIGACMLVAGFEWTRLTKMHALWQRVGFLLLQSVVMAALWFLLEAKSQIIFIVLLVAVAWWLLCAFLVFGKSQGFNIQSRPYILVVFIGLIVLVPTWLALVSLHASEVYGPLFVFFIVLMNTFADSGAFFAGRRWGSRKLSPNISPAKTWEGVWGAAFVVAILSAAFGASLFNLTLFQLVLFVPFCIVILFFSVLGDLFESMMKRKAKVKDSGRIFPGHGGMLDRIDSLTAAAPIFVAGLLLQEMVK